ncbi:MAG: ATP-binding protein [Ilumatobacteraceae bacterium]
MGDGQAIEISRRIVEVAQRRMQTELVIAIHGPRSVGKSTVLRRLAHDFGTEVIDLDNSETRNAFAADPALFITETVPLFLDEYQRVPASLDAIKAVLNQSAVPGRFVITGSTRHESLPPVTQALTGRLHILDLFPLSQGEIAGVHENFLEVALNHPVLVARNNTKGISRGDYIGRVCAGGFPLALQRDGASRERWFDDYVRLSIERDVELIAPRIRQATQLAPLLERLASQTGQVLNIAASADQIRMNKSTAENYVGLLEDVYLVRRLPAWGKTLRSRVSQLPKIHIVDSGLAARLLRLTPSRLATLNPSVMSEFGHLLETFVVGELTKQSTWLDEHVELSHWRTRDGEEVDLVVERDNGQILAFEVKAAAQINDSDLKSMRLLRSITGSSFGAGFLFYTGERSYTIEDRIHVVPISRLWSPLKPIVNDSGEHREMTDPEFAQHLIDQAEWRVRRVTEEKERAAKDAARQSAREKLVALGLTEDEISALSNQ